MASQDQLKKINEQLINILRELLATGNWEASLFLRTAHKKLQDLCDEAVATANQLHAVDQPKSLISHQTRVDQGYFLVYVSIYQSDPYNLRKWENTLKNIKEYSIARPIYRSEEHIQEAIRSKKGAVNEGYVSVYIKKNDIIPPYPGKLLEDRFGHELLTIRDNALKMENIVEFVHHGKRFELIEGKLSLKSEGS
jgi:Dot/Icm secretion system protein IcmQ